MKNKRLLHYTKVQPYDSHPELPIDPDAVQSGQYRWPPHFTPSLIFVVFIGGCAGAYARYYVSQYMPSTTNGWPISTLFVNLLGAFLLGFLLEGLVRIGPDQGTRRLVRLAVGTGFMGAFTTYSSFVSDIYLLLQHHHMLVAASYGSLTILGGLVLSALGIWSAASHHERRENRA